MEEGCGSWHPQHQFGWQSPKLNSLTGPVEVRDPIRINASVSVNANLVTTNETSLIDAYSGLPQLQAGRTNEPHGWFYCLPRFRKNFAPARSSFIKEKPSAGPQEVSRLTVTPNARFESGQKRFLVFDQSGDQTTLVYSSLIGPPVEPFTSWGSKPSGAYSLSGKNREFGRLNYQSGPILTDEFNESHRADAGSELHEDTEELNALLYSDDETYETEDEETSTGHSPSAMTDHDSHEWFEVRTEEAFSSARAVKRQKLSSGRFNLPSLMDTASSENPNGHVGANEYAECSSADSNVGPEEELGPLSGNKRIRKDKIRETVSILQSIIPGGKGKDAAVVLDEAINYLKSLKVEAMAMGLNTL